MKNQTTQTTSKPAQKRAPLTQAQKDAKAAKALAAKKTKEAQTQVKAQAGLTMSHIAALSLIAQRFIKNGLAYHAKQGSITKRGDALVSSGKLASREIKHEGEIMKSLTTGADTPQGGRMVKVAGGKFPYHLDDPFIVAGRADSQAIFSLMLKA